MKLNSIKIACFLKILTPSCSQAMAGQLKVSFTYCKQHKHNLISTLFFVFEIKDLKRSYTFFKGVPPYNISQDCTIRISGGSTLKTSTPNMLLATDE
jgi:hypothetical protein